MDYLEIGIIIAVAFCAGGLFHVGNSILANKRSIETVAKVNSQLFKKEPEHCRKCNVELVENAKFCHICGTLQKLSCSECQSFAPLGSRFCPQCKHRLWIENGEK